MGVLAEQIDGVKAVPLIMEQINGEVYALANATYRHSDVVYNIRDNIKDKIGTLKCKVYCENLGIRYNTNASDEKCKKDEVVPDVMIVCDRSKLKGGCYYGVPKFVAEVASPSTAARDRTLKMRIYQNLGVSEYWLVKPQGSLEIYYLKNGNYELFDDLVFCNDNDDDDYNANKIITLREFPNVSMTLGDIFFDYDEES